MKRLYALLLGVGLACTGAPALADWGVEAFGKSEPRRFDPDRDLQGRRFHHDYGSCRPWSSESSTRHSPGNCRETDRPVHIWLISLPDHAVVHVEEDGNR